MSQLTMSPFERNIFLSERRVGVIAVEQPEAAPLAVPVWFVYAEGLFSFHTALGHVKTRLVVEAGRFSICVQSEEVPYRYVSADGPVVVVEPVPPPEREAMVRKYFDFDRAVRYLQETATDAANDVAVRMRPQRWRTVDFAKSAAGS